MGRHETQYINRMKRASQRLEFIGSVGGLVVIAAFGRNYLSGWKLPNAALALLMLPFAACCGAGAFLQWKLPAEERTPPTVYLLRVSHPYSTFLLFLMMELLLILMSFGEKLGPKWVNALLFGICAVLLAGEIALYVWAVRYEKGRTRHREKKHRGGRRPH